VFFGQSIDKIRFQNDLGFVLSQGLTPFSRSIVGRGDLWEGDLSISATLLTVILADLQMDVSDIRRDILEATTSLCKENGTVPAQPS